MITPIYAGRCLMHTETLNTAPRSGYKPSAGVRIVSPSGGGGDEHYCPASDVYMHLSAVEAQELSALNRKACKAWWSARRRGHEGEAGSINFAQMP